MPELHLHHLENSRSFRILWLLEELGLNYELTSYERDSKTQLAPTSLLKIHPTGKAPILEVKNTDGTVTPLIESGHIIDYLMAKYDGDNELHPNEDADSQQWLAYNLWMHYAEASAMPPFIMRLIFNKIVTQSPKLIKPVTKSLRKQIEAFMISSNIQKTLELVETQLTSNRWFSGSNFSAADIQMVFIIEVANLLEGLDELKSINTLNWLKRCQSRPAYQQAVKKGGKLEFR